MIGVLIIIVFQVFGIKYWVLLYQYFYTTLYLYSYRYVLQSNITKIFNRKKTRIL